MQKTKAMELTSLIRVINKLDKLRDENDHW